MMMRHINDSNVLITQIHCESTVRNTLNLYITFTYDFLYSICDTTITKTTNKTEGKRGNETKFNIPQWPILLAIKFILFLFFQLKYNVACIIKVGNWCRVDLITFNAFHLFVYINECENYALIPTLRVHHTLTKMIIKSVIIFCLTLFYVIEIFIVISLMESELELMDAFIKQTSVG